MQNYYNDFDYSGNYYDGYEESEEERRRREKELADRAVQTQEIKTYGDGTVEETMSREYAPTVQPQSIEPVQPIQPVQQMPQAQPVAQPRPVDPETYNRMIQAESRGRDFDAQGQPLTSPKGAMFAAQVMPATAASPGFGVRPAQSQTPEEYNRVGREYYQAMLQKYNGDEQAAAAAYNAGPGRIDQNIRANAGVLNVGQLPQETQKYLQQVLPQQPGLDASGRANAAMDSRVQAAQPAQQPAMPVAAQQPAIPVDAQAMLPEQQPAESQYSLATGTAPKLGFVSPPAGQAQQSAQYINNYQAAQDDPMKLLALRSDEAAPKFIRERAGEQAYELMNKEVQKKTAEQQAQQLAQAAASGDRKASNTIAKELQDQGGSWLKYVLLGFLDPRLQAEEAVKLGIGNKWTTTTDSDGKPAMIQVNAKGLPLKGYTADGNEIATKDLVSYAAGGKQRELDIVGGTYVNDVTKEVGRVVTDKRTGQSFVQTETGRKPMTGFRPQSSGGTLEQQAAAQEQKQRINLFYEPAISAASKGAATLAEFNAMNGTNFAIAGRDSLGMPLLVDQRSGQILTRPAGAAPAGGAVPPTAPAAGAVPPTAAPGAPAMPAGATPADIQSRRDFDKAQRTKVAEAAGTVVAGAAGFLDKIDQVNEGITATTKKNNLGTIAQGIIPGERLLGKYVMSSEDQRNTDKAINAVKVISTEGLKALGTQPTDADRDYLTANIPDETWTSEAVKDWLTSRREYIKRKIDTAQKQIETGGTYVPPIPKDPEANTQAMTPADKARAELERRKKEKK